MVDMAQYYLPDSTIENFDNDAWRCSHCQYLQYNLLIGTDRKRYPIPGAPEPNPLSPDYPDVCTLCLQMYRIVAERPYFVQLHREYREKHKQIDRLRPGSEYL